MELQLLFDEERYITGEEQSRPAEEEKDGWEGGSVTWCDVTFRRVRLFKADAVIKRNRASRGGYQPLPLYIVIEDRYSWIGEDPQWPVESQRRRTYVTGSDSVRIRQAASIAEGYGGKVNN